MTKENRTSNPMISNQLKKIFKREAVRALVSAQNWQDAIQIAGQLLVNIGSINQSYVDAMEKVIRDLGPYAVISPGIVLLHARPEDGVNEPCFGLVTLLTPVPFGHTQNDPVDLVFVLGATDKSSHIQALQNLAGLLSDPTSLTKLRASKTDDQLFNVIQSWDGNP